MVLFEVEVVTLMVVVIVMTMASVREIALEVFT